jgi:hypothetical protein
MYLKKHIFTIIFSLPIIVCAQSMLKEEKAVDYFQDTLFCIRHDEYHPSAWTKANSFKVGYSYSSFHSVEIGIQWLHLIGSYCDHFGTSGFTAGNEFVFDKGLIFGPKLSYEAHFLFLGTRLNSTYYTSNFREGSLKIRPEIGISLLGYFNIFYGYTFNITNQNYYYQKHSISVFGTIPTFKFFGKRYIKQRKSSL